jgi:hypothetical protein
MQWQLTRLSIANFLDFHSFYLILVRNCRGNRTPLKPLQLFCVLEDTTHIVQCQDGWYC